LTVQQAEVIYYEKYWKVNRCGELPSGLDYTIFDYGVNSGVGRSARGLNTLLGSAGGNVITPETIKAAWTRDAKQLIVNVNAERLSFLKRLKTWALFGKGWGRRVSEVRETSLVLAAPGAAELAKRHTGPIAVPTAPGTSPGRGAVPAKPKTEATTTTAASGGLLAWASTNPEYIVFAIFGAIAIGVALNFVFEYARKRSQEHVDVLDFASTHPELGSTTVSTVQGAAPIGG
jgi:lysozyme family protein